MPELMYACLILKPMYTSSRMRMHVRTTDTILSPSCVHAFLSLFKIFFYSNVVFPFLLMLHIFHHCSCLVFSLSKTNLVLKLLPTHVESEELILLAGNPKLEVANYSLRIY